MLHAKDATARSCGGHFAQRLGMIVDIVEGLNIYHNVDEQFWHLHFVLKRKMHVASAPLMAAKAISCLKHWKSD